MAPPIGRDQALRQRRLAQGLREVRLILPDARSFAVRGRVAEQVATLDSDHERDAMKWIEAVTNPDDDSE
jgi:hypothetical protein